MRILIALVAIALALPAVATDRHDHMVRIEQRTVYVTDHKHDGATYALVGAAITYWLVHRRRKRSAQPVAPLAPADCPAPQCPALTCAEPVRRAEAACGK